MLVIALDCADRERHQEDVPEAPADDRVHHG